MILVAVSLTVLWIVLTYIALSAKETHSLFRLLLVLAAGGVSLAVDPIAKEIHHLLWISPLIGLVANGWTMVIKIDKRTAVSMMVGAIITFLFVWGISPRQAAEAENFSPPPLPEIAEVLQREEPSPLSEDFLKMIRRHQ